MIYSIQLFQFILSVVDLFCWTLQIYILSDFLVICQPNDHCIIWTSVVIICLDTKITDFNCCLESSTVMSNLQSSIALAVVAVMAMVDHHQ